MGARSMIDAARICATSKRSRGRPLGEVRTALMQAASLEPGTVRELAARAQVGFGAAAYTCSRLQSAGQLVRVSDGRPARLVATAASTRSSGPGWAQMLQRWSSRSVAASTATSHDFAAL